MTLAEYRRRRGEPADADDQIAGDAHTEKHPGALEYAQIGLILGVITAIEVGVYYVGLSQTALVIALLAFSTSKFTLVVLWFMHLKFDARLFSTMFVLAFLLALSIFAVALATLGGKLV
ncbi:MAG TPA: cytochrome C oxidase subunit IV family protein [Dehalococcoidia bacterium]|nr:cytochrome C oxidase subunit IV family protein [Dehalococcoidia bacterium]